MRLNQVVSVPVITVGLTVTRVCILRLLLVHRDQSALWRLYWFIYTWRWTTIEAD